ncbi:hypothetical protein [Nocardiopsis sp. YSL2]|uniref:hypothetical protein n=1 Tax=Nocardiopsis sp. YSL2 TaxID=2939492 RepID=UPI0026F41ED8|nr:hypothetical protein [Nocardiopsis sp. YSL2]
MILSILATVAVLAAIATIAAALLLAETTLVYFALGLGGISVLLLLAALVQGGIRAARQDRTRTGTDGLGKSSVPAVATTAATSPGTHGGPEDSGRAPAPAHEPVRDSVVSEQKDTGFTPGTEGRPESAAGSHDPDPALPYGHVPDEDARFTPEPEPSDYRIPHQTRTEDHPWSAEPHERAAPPEPMPRDTESFSDWATTRADAPSAADDADGGEGRVLPAPADELPAESAAPDTDAEVDLVSGDTAEVGALAEANTFDTFGQDDPSGAADADIEEPVAEETTDPAHADAHAADGADTVEERDALRGAEHSAEEDPDDADEDEAPRFNYRVPTADASDDAEARTDDTVVGARDEPDGAPVPTGAAQGTADPAGASGTDESDTDEAVQTEEDADATAAFSYRVPVADTDGAAEQGADQAPEAAEPDDQDPQEAVASPYRIPGASAAVTDTDEADRVEKDADEEDADADATAAFSYRAPVAETDEHPSVAYTAIPDSDDEPSTGDDPSRRQDPDQVS